MQDLPREVELSEAGLKANCLYYNELYHKAQTELSRLAAKANKAYAQYLDKLNERK